MEKATSALSGLRLDNFPERTRHRAEKVLSIRGKVAILLSSIKAKRTRTSRGRYHPARPGHETWVMWLQVCHAPGVAIRSKSARACERPLLGVKRTCRLGHVRLGYLCRYTIRPLARS